MVEDMKGKIRVYCRARPMSKTELQRVSFGQEYECTSVLSVSEIYECTFMAFYCQTFHIIIGDTVEFYTHCVLNSLSFGVIFKVF